MWKGLFTALRLGMRGGFEPELLQCNTSCPAFEHIAALMGATYGCSLRDSAPGAGHRKMKSAVAEEGFARDVARLRTCEEEHGLCDLRTIGGALQRGALAFSFGDFLGSFRAE